MTVFCILSTCSVASHWEFQVAGFNKHVYNIRLSFCQEGPQRVSNLTLEVKMEIQRPKWVIQGKQLSGNRSETVSQIDLRWFCYDSHVHFTDEQSEICRLSPRPRPGRCKEVEWQAAGTQPDKARHDSQDGQPPCAWHPHVSHHLTLQSRGPVLENPLVSVSSQGPAQGHSPGQTRI